jgi:hypothetical protein
MSSSEVNAAQMKGLGYFSVLSFVVAAIFFFDYSRKRVSTDAAVKAESNTVLVLAIVSLLMGLGAGYKAAAIKKSA